MPDVATNLEALTPAWLTAALSTRFPGIAVDAVNVRPLDTGLNFAGNLAHVELTGVTGAGGVPRTMVAKLVPESPVARELGLNMGLYLRETLFYTALASAVPTRTPDCYAAPFDAESGLAALLLEDLTHFDVGTQKSGYTPDRARATVRQFADLHAAFWDAGELADIAWLPVWNQPEMVDFVRGAFTRVWPACQDVFAAHLTADDIDLGNIVGSALADLMNAIAEPPVTLLHGDARYDNLLFDRADASAPPQTIDWQFVARGRGTQDIAYFVSQSAGSDVAAAHERSLVVAYHERLVEHGVSNYPADACWADYRKFALYSLVYPVFAAAMVDPSDTAQVGGTAIILRRGFDAARRLDAVSLLRR